MSEVTPIRMPKWGLSMQEGAIVEWCKAQGDTIAEGDDLVDIETSKITNVCESPAAGVLRRIVAQPGETLPVGALIGVLAASVTPEAEIDAYIADFQANFTPEESAEADGAGLATTMVEAAGRTLRVARLGPEEGTPVVLIHGYSGDLNNWMFNIEELAARNPVIALDLPGHGGSTKDVGDGSLRTLADSVGATLDVLAVSRAHLVGHSLGAAVAARLAADRPGLAASLTLIAPAGLSASPISEEFLIGVIEAQRAKDLRPVLELLLADPAAVTKDMLDDMIKFKRLDGVEEALSALRDRMIEGHDAASLRADLAKIPSALVIASREDRIVGAPDEAALPAGFTVAWIAGAGHMPHLEKSGEVNALLAGQVGGA
ncbi:acetoin dehydrogenase dihydrolipoyllysine-residue acetyltransferase subunit [Phenylobacterium sp.]|uniref:acetoin dehydrogenase dihydrolipoyllysine-residue acetyltransferase subunit n=1 Tax=Phenylobacterium sp. TaxID=1871053 RepID=UPI0025FE917D|nr:acetoin dehydrogenase dihydrolipoyllysine-residue acetyltransferase subunit [Phenylobacterium sp.]